ncbi:MAG: hypothetical protein WCA31_01520 [Acidimicrobiales bacterium]
MKKTFRSAVASLAVVTGSFGAVAVAFAAQANPASASTMMSHSWHGTVEKVNAKMGTEESFTLKVGTKTYKVDYTTMTKFTMGSSKDVKAGAMMSVTGTLSGSTIKASKLSL